jgi:DNA-binding MarR family transcriptional regulator
MNAGDVWLEHWFAGMRWRRRVESELERLKLSLAQWLVLDSLEILLRETGDAVSQLQVGQRLELDKSTISLLMQRLERRGLIDRAPACVGRENRIYLPGEGRRLAIEGRAIVEEVSATLSLAQR